MISKRESSADKVYKGEENQKPKEQVEATKKVRVYPEGKPQVEGKYIERAELPQNYRASWVIFPLTWVDSTLLTSNDGELPTCYLERA